MVLLFEIRSYFELGYSYKRVYIMNDLHKPILS